MYASEWCMSARQSRSSATEGGEYDAAALVAFAHDVAAKLAR
jgi:hypothetical protein